MDELAQEALRRLREIKSVTFAAVKDGYPTARTIDVMFVDDTGLYFLTARGKSFYRQLKALPYVSICGMDENFVSVRAAGDVRFCGDSGVVDMIFEHNPMMNDLYPGQKRYVLEGLHLFRGKGEIFDLSKEPPFRRRFAFGGAAVEPAGYTITEDCTACGLCKDACPVDVIFEGEICRIDRQHCLECGSCFEVCPDDAVEAAQGL